MFDYGLAMDTAAAQVIRDKIRQALTQQQEKMARLGPDSKYLQWDEGYLAALETCMSIAAGAHS